MRNPKETPLLSLFSRQQQPSLAEFESLLDLFPQATLLLDLKLGHILLANTKATELTAFTRAELTQHTCNTFFPELNGRRFRPNPEITTPSISTPILTRNGNRLEAFVTLRQLDTAGSWGLATLIPAGLYQQTQVECERLATRFENMQSLVSALLEPDLPRALDLALLASQRLIGAGIFALYLGQSFSPELRMTASLGEVTALPENIPAAELTSLLRPHLWERSRRALNLLDRRARTARWSYLASAPLGEQGATTGLLVIADPTAVASKEELARLQLITATLTTLLQFHGRANELTATNKRQQRALVIREMIKEAVGEGVILVAPDLTIVEMNPSAEWALGYASREVTKRPIEDVLIGVENLIPALQSAQQGIPSHNLGNVRLHRRDGEAFLAHIHILPVIVEETIESILILLRDLSEHDQFRIRNQQLEQRAILGEVTAIFAHEVRNPINNISTGLQLMALNLPDDDPNQEIITRLEEDCARLTQLMQSVLAFSRPAESKMEVVDLNLLLEHLLERWRPRLARFDIQHHFSPSTKPSLVIGNPRSLEQVFANLINNAIEAMSERGGTLAVNLRAAIGLGNRPQIEVSVSDNGPGIPEEIRDRIFEPFFTTNSSGTGLGLAIAKRIITAHKGTISVISVPGGTVFQVILPATEQPSI